MRPDPARLKTIPLFSALSDEERARVASWLEIREVTPGRRITPEGASGYEFFVIEQGTADVARDGVVIASLSAGDHFGEAAIMGGGRRVADVVATSPMTLFVMFGTSFRELEANLPDVAAQISSTLRERLSAL